MQLLITNNPDGADRLDRQDSSIITKALSVSTLKNIYILIVPLLVGVLLMSQGCSNTNTNRSRGIAMDYNGDYIGHVPNLGGTGTVKHLYKAMDGDDQLKLFVNNNLSDVKSIRKNMNMLMFMWSGLSKKYNDLNLPFPPLDERGQLSLSPADKAWIYTSFSKPAVTDEELISKSLMHVSSPDEVTELDMHYTLIKSRFAGIIELVSKYGERGLRYEPDGDMLLISDSKNFLKAIDIDNASDGDMIKLIAYSNFIHKFQDSNAYFKLKDSRFSKYLDMEYIIKDGSEGTPLTNNRSRDLVILGVGDNNIIVEDERYDGTQQLYEGAYDMLDNLYILAGEYSNNIGLIHANSTVFIENYQFGSTLITAASPITIQYGKGVTLEDVEAIKEPATFNDSDNIFIGVKNSDGNFSGTHKLVLNFMDLMDYTIEDVTIKFMDNRSIALSTLLEETS